MCLMVPFSSALGQAAPVAKAELLIDRPDFRPCDRSPGGRYLLGLVGAPGAPRSLYLADADRERDPFKVDERVLWGRNSADGRWIAYLKEGREGPELYLADRYGKKKKRLAHRRKFEIGKSEDNRITGAAMDWSNSSGSVYLALTEAGLPGRIRIKRVNLEGRVSSALTVESISSCGDGPIRSLDVHEASTQVLFVAGAEGAVCLGAYVRQGERFSDVSVPCPGATVLHAFFDPRGERIYLLTDADLMRDPKEKPSGDSGRQARLYALRIRDWNLSSVEEYSIRGDGAPNDVLVAPSPGNRFMDLFFTELNGGASKVHMVRRMHPSSR